MIDIERLLDNAACATQNRELLRDDDGEETVLRKCVRLNVAEPIIAELKAVLEAAGKVLCHECGGTGKIHAGKWMPCPDCADLRARLTTKERKP